VPIRAFAHAFEDKREAENMPVRQSGRAVFVMIYLSQANLANICPLREILVIMIN
jgi:hypothetical protein